MKTVNSLSGGKTSSYIAANYPADYNIFALVRTDDKNCIYPDAKVRQIVSDKIGKEFIGTLEDDVIIDTMLDLEQFIGQEIHWTSGKTFDKLINGNWNKGKNGSHYLPNIMTRYCTSELKTMPILYWIYETIKEPVYMRFGYRANETNRAKNMMAKTDEDGFTKVKATFSKLKDGRNSWSEYRYCKPLFPLIDDNIYKDNIEAFWVGKPVRFAYMNNCVGCFHRNEMLLKKMFEMHPKKMDWFLQQENKNTPNTFKKGITYNKIKNHKLQTELNFDDFNECDSGYCGL